ncbi:unnamed protein product [Rotaria socialis]|nr:unnamed protein product [Rotaria socialis]
MQGKAVTTKTVATDIVVGLATGGVGYGIGKVAGAVGSKINNPVPSRVARVVPYTEENITHIGRSSSNDVFVTNPSDIRGLNSIQIAEKLTIPKSPTGFKVFEFRTPDGIASPINRTNLGFVGQGKTAGGASEFVVPNQQIPKDVKTTIVKP